MLSKPVESQKGTAINNKHGDESREEERSFKGGKSRHRGASEELKNFKLKNRNKTIGFAQKKRAKWGLLHAAKKLEGGRKHTTRKR